MRLLSLVFVYSFLSAPHTSGFSMSEMDDREKIWQEVDLARTKSLPKTAAKLLERIYDSAMADEEYPEAVKALATKYSIEGSFNQPQTPYVIRKIMNEVDSLAPNIRPIMKVILAHWFYSYYQQNRWKFAQRTQSSSNSEEDLEVWDLNQILNKIDLLFRDALQSAEQLKTIPIGEYQGLLENGTVDDRYRPTLYDFVAFQAIGFYSLDEQLVRQQNAFQLDPSSPVFSAATDFVNWKPNASTENSFLLNAVKIFQDLLKFHANDDDRTAFFDADFARLKFAYQASTAKAKEERYLASLRSLAKSTRDHEISSMIHATIANNFHAKQDLVAAHNEAEIGLKRFPDSPGGKTCFNILQTIEARELNISAERIWNASIPTINVSYRNIDKVFFRLVKYDYDKLRWGESVFVENLPRQQKIELINRKVVKEWSVDLEKGDDFKSRNRSIAGDSGLKPGCYVLIGSGDPDFKLDDNNVSLAEVWFSKLAVISKHDVGSTKVLGQVFDAIDGQPISNAKISVQAWIRDGRNSRSVELGAVRTDENGEYQMDGNRHSVHRVTVQNGMDSLSFVDQSYKHITNSALRTQRQTIFFTDRSIYRPGQTVQFKGVCISSNADSNEYDVLKNESVEVEFRDINNQAVASKRFRSNEFGSISGSFEIPDGLATGRMRIEVRRGPNGSGFFNVEEYKRPKFIVNLNKPDSEFSLNETVEISGNAKSYSGAAIDDAKFRWRVVRNVRYPQWWYWRNWWAARQPEPAQEIANGTGRTASNGNFQFSFEALPDEKVLEKSCPVFSYSITVDVIDSTGETRSANSLVQLGFVAIETGVDCEDWQVSENPVSVNLTTKTLDGKSIAARGVVTVNRLREPKEIQRKALVSGYRFRMPEADRESDFSKINGWENGEQVFEKFVELNATGSKVLPIDLPAGAYRVVFQVKDKNGAKTQAEKTFVVLDLVSRKFNIAVPNYLVAKSKTVSVGEEFVAVWGSGYANARAFVEIEHRGNCVRKYWTDSDRNQQIIRIPVSESMRGGFQVRLILVHENRAYIENHQIDVPWDNKSLDIRWERFVSKLTPAAKETWTAVIQGPSAEKVAAEMVATLYDASLDAYAPHRWNPEFNVFYTDYSKRTLSFQNTNKFLTNVSRGFKARNKSVRFNYRRFANDVAPQIWLGQGIEKISRSLNSDQFMYQATSASFGAPMQLGRNSRIENELMLPSKGLRPVDSSIRSDSNSGLRNNPVNLDSVPVRKSLQETAFFYPRLTTDSEGKIRIEFEMPEALTEWKFLGFAHDNQLKAGLLEATAVTSKDLMVQPNPPRFLRQGDELEFSVKVLNQSATRQTGEIQLSFSDAFTDEKMDSALNNLNKRMPFDLAAGRSKSYSWNLKVPDFVGVLKYKVVGATARLSDGEEGLLPVLSNKILVTESLPISIRGNQSKTLQFKRLVESKHNQSLENKTLTFQMASNPAWYAVMSLPYLMEYPHQCSEQTFNRLYANLVGQHIVQSDDKIKQILAAWRGSKSLESPLEKNEGLRNVLLSESPWLLEAKQQTEAQRNVAALFDSNRMSSESRSTFRQLREMQFSDGAWPWFPGGRANDYLTLYITTGFGRLRHLGVQCDLSLATKALDRLDYWIDQKYQRLKEKKRLADNNLDPLECLYLYGRSFFLKDRPIATRYQQAVDYFRQQGRDHWASLSSRQAQSQLAIGLHRFGERIQPKEILDSLSERATSDEELGLFWRDQATSWWWYHAPIETQAMMIEAYDEIAGDSQKVEECKIWLLKQKQVQSWKTTKATADAIYSLLLRGGKPTSNQMVEVQIGDLKLRPSEPEAGTGFFERRFVNGEIRPEFGKIEIAKKDNGIAWGNMTWQFLERMDQIETYESTPLKLKKNLYRKTNGRKGPEISSVNGTLAVGDELISRIELKVDRDMEFIHLKDYRGSGTEPVNVISQYKFQDGLSYYETTRDEATHFFIDYLPRGTYVFEYPIRVQHQGKYESGIATLQSMYAPEFNSHSESLELVVE